MTTNNEYYQRILTYLTGELVSEDLSDVECLKLIAEYYGLSSSPIKCKGQYLKYIAESFNDVTYTGSHSNNYYLSEWAGDEGTENQLLSILVRFYNILADFPDVSWNVTSVSNNVGRKCYKNILLMPSNDSFIIKFKINVISIGKWHNQGLCFTTSLPVDNTTNVTDNYGAYNPYRIVSEFGSLNDQGIRIGSVDLVKGKDYSFKIKVIGKEFIEWVVYDANGEEVTGGSSGVDLTSYNYISYNTFEGVNMSLKDYMIIIEDTDS